MPFYDYNLTAENIQETLNTAKALGFSGVCLSTKWTNIESLKSFKNQIASFKKIIDISVGVEIKEKHTKIPELVNSLRREAELILVHGGDLEVNRVAVETAGVDILLHPELGRDDSGIDHTMARLAKKNNVAIEFSLSGLIHSSGLTRSRLWHSLLENSKLVKKYKVPFVLTSGAANNLGIRSPFDLLSFGRVLGFQDPEINVALSDSIVKENRKRLSSKWVMPGVEVVE